MDAIHVAKVYAQALLDIGIEKNNVADIDAELRSLHQVIKGEEDVFNFFISPKVPKLEKQKLIDKLSGSLSDTMLSLFSILIKNERILFISEILKQFSEAYDRLQNKRRAKVITSSKMNQTEMDEIHSILNSKFAGNCEVENIIKPEVIGGFIIKMDDVIIDASIKTKLDSIKTQLLSKKFLDGARFYEN